MAYNLLADLVVLIHFLFVLFSLLGALLVIRWRKMMWLHLPAALWAAGVEFSGRICPLTPLENWLRIRGGGAGYAGDFIEQYLLWILYPSGLTREVQICLGAIVVGINIGIYGYLIFALKGGRIILKETQDTHSKTIGYILWIFGFTGSHRFYYGYPVVGTIYFFTLGLLFIGWIIDLFLIPSMGRKADVRFASGPIDYNLAWILLTFLGLFGIHRMYMGKWISGILYMLSGGILGMGVIYDFWTLNDQITLINSKNELS